MRACIYNRCSTEEESQKNALEIQTKESREIVEGKGWIVVKQYVETQSGTTTYRRNEYQKMLQDMSENLFDVVVVKSIDRLTRSAKDWYLFLEKLTQNQKQLYLYIDQKFYTPDDNLLAGIKAILAEDFSRELSKKIKNAHRRRQEKKTGLNITVPIFGWDKVGKDEYVLNPQEAEIYRLAFAMAEEGNGFYTIAKKMYDRGVRSKRGGRISEVQWRKMLHSPRAHGAVALHTKEYDFERKETRKLPESEWIIIEGALPAIVSREYQEYVLGTLRKRPSGKIAVKKEMYPLSGKVYCSECGAPYYRSNKKVRKEKRVAWKCSTYLKQGRERGCKNVTVLENEIFKAVEQEYQTYKPNDTIIIKEVTLEAVSLLHQVLEKEICEKDIKQFRKKVERLQGKKKRLLDKLLEDIIDDEMYRDLCGGIEEEIQMLQFKITRLQEISSSYGVVGGRLQAIEEVIEKEIVRQAILKAILLEVERIVVCPNGQLQVHFHKNS